MQRNNEYYNFEKVGKGEMGQAVQASGLMVDMISDFLQGLA